MIRRNDTDPASYDPHEDPYNGARERNEDEFNSDPPFYVDRVMSHSDLEDLADALDGSDESIEHGMRICNKDIEDYDEDEIKEALEDRIGFVFDEDLNAWTYE